MKRKLGIISIIAASLLIGCGSNSSSSSNNNTNTGYFIDSEVSGVAYETTTGLSGITDQYGRFQYHTGDSVKLSIGKLTLGESKPNTDGLLTPKLLIVGDNTEPTTQEMAQITLLLQTLQSLDSDNNSTNGITIGTDVTDDLSSLDNEIIFNSVTENDLLGLDNTYDLGLDEDYDGYIDVSASDAETHFQNTQTDWEYGNRPDDTGKDDPSINTTNTNTNQFDLSIYPITTNMTTELKNSLAYMGNEERLAHDVYMNIYNYHTANNNLEIQQLTNIATKSETTHIQIVRDVVDRYNITHNDVTVDSSVDANSTTDIDVVSGEYNIAVIQNLYNTLYNLGIQDQESALKVGCMVEVTDIEDLDKYIIQAQNSNATDVVEAFTILRDGSYSHYWAFDKGLKAIGIVNGCYYENDSLLGENKTEIYPTNSNNSQDNTQSSTYGGGKQYGKSN